MATQDLGPQLSPPKHHVIAEKIIPQILSELGLIIRESSGALHGFLEPEEASGRCHQELACGP